MPRTLNPQAHALRRDAFIDAATSLIQAKGYEQMTVQDVLDELDASRGAFYHYFESKEVLLEAVVERTVEVATASVAPLLGDPDLDARRKLEGMFAGISQWKAERTDLMLAIMRVWLSDDNVLVRERLRHATRVRLTPMLAAVVRQGIAEGTFTTGAPDHTARVLVSLILGLNEVATELYVARQANAVTFEHVECALTAYIEAFERILGLRAGSLTMVNGAALRQWFG